MANQESATAPLPIQLVEYRPGILNQVTLGWYAIPGYKAHYLELTNTGAAFAVCARHTSAESGSARYAPEYPRCLRCERELASRNAAEREWQGMEGGQPP